MYCRSGRYAAYTPASESDAETIAYWPELSRMPNVQRHRKWRRRRLRRRQRRRRLIVRGGKRVKSIGRARVRPFTGRSDDDPEDERYRSQLAVRAPESSLLRNPVRTVVVRIRENGTSGLYFLSKKQSHYDENQNKRLNGSSGRTQRSKWLETSEGTLSIFGFCVWKN